MPPYAAAAMQKPSEQMRYASDAAMMRCCGASAQQLSQPWLSHAALSDTVIAETAAGFSAPVRAQTGIFSTALSFRYYSPSLQVQNG
jgi:hypothetical protein